VDRNGWVNAAAIHCSALAQLLAHFIA